MKTKMMLSLLTVGSLSVLLSACTAPAPPPPAPVDMTALTAKIQAMEDAYAAATVKKDPDAVLAYYADDLVSYSKEKEPATSKPMLRERLAEQMAKDSAGTTPKFKVLELFMEGDNLTEIGSWTDTDATGAVKDHGTYFSVFRKNGENWQCIRDIAVSATPKAEPAPAAAAVVTP